VRALLVFTVLSGKGIGVKVDAWNYYNIKSDLVGNFCTHKAHRIEDILDYYQSIPVKLTSSNSPLSMWILYFRRPTVEQIVQFMPT